VIEFIDPLLLQMIDLIAGILPFIMAIRPGRHRASGCATGAVTAGSATGAGATTIGAGVITTARGAT